jgi:hypothetical protein
LQLEESREVSDQEQDHREIEDGKEYSLFTSADRASFLLRDKANGLTANLRGEDASRFRQDYDEIKGRFPNWSADQLLAQLWDQGGYSWLAEQKE